jgi:hypothetical protein
MTFEIVLLIAFVLLFTLAVFYIYTIHYKPPRSFEDIDKIKLKELESKIDTILVRLGVRKV